MNQDPLVLLVDDSPLFLNLYRSYLKSTPVRLAETRSCSEALSFCAGERPALVLVNFNLPDATGADCCRQIRTVPGMKPMPVIVVCDPKQPQEESASRQAECSDVLFKPLRRMEFLSVGARHLFGIREVRRPCLVSVRCGRRGTAFVGRGLDMSGGGIFIESDEAVPLGEPLEMEIQLGRPGSAASWMGCRGEVAWLNRRGQLVKESHPVGFGVRFTWMKVEDSGALADFLETLDHK
jgi:CheY-like chemotaxis protein